MTTDYTAKARELAEKIGNVVYGCDKPDCPACGPSTEQIALIAAALREAAAVEREACAQIAAERGREYHENFMRQELADDYELNEGASAAASEIEARIRARARGEVAK